MLHLLVLYFILTVATPRQPVFELHLQCIYGSKAYAFSIFVAISLHGSVDTWMIDAEHLNIYARKARRAC